MSPPPSPIPNLTALLPVVGCILLAFPFLVPHTWPLIFFGFAALALFVRLYRGTAMRAFFLGFVGGFIYMGAVLFWFLDAAPLDWAGVSSNTLSKLLAGGAWFYTAAMLAIPVGLWHAVAVRMRAQSISDAVVLSALWILFESVRALVFSVVTAGRLVATTAGDDWTFGFAGYALAESDALLSLAPLGGVYLVGFAGVFASFLVVTAVFSLPVRRAAIAVFFAVLVFFAGEFSADRARAAARPISESDGVRVAALYTRFPSYFHLSDAEFTERGAALETLVSKTMGNEKKLDIVVLPEDMRFLSFLGARRDDFAKNIFGGRKTLLIDSSRSETAAGTFGIAAYWNTGENHPRLYFKNLLVPGGEFMPSIIAVPLSFFGGTYGRDLVSKFRLEREYTSGRALAAAEFGNTRVGALFCSEIISPRLYRDMVKEERAGVLVNVASQSAFSGKRLERQIMQFARMRAAETGRYFIRAGNATPSFILDDRGRVVVWHEGAPGAAVGLVIPKENHTPYVRFGAWVVWFSLFVVARATMNRDLKKRSFGWFKTV